MVQYMFYIMRSTTCLPIIQQYKHYIIFEVQAHTLTGNSTSQSTMIPASQSAGSNTIPSLPVNLDSDAEHSVHDINSPKKNAAPVQKQKNHIVQSLIHLIMLYVFSEHYKFVGTISREGHLCCLLCCIVFPNMFHIIEQKMTKAKKNTCPD
ncbi:hypothetical protein ACJX0J_031269 [Zea mays]